MTVACIIIRNLPCRVETARNSSLRHDPLVIYDPDAPFQRVVDASPGWRIHPEMPMDTAFARCPEAVTLPADSALYAQQWRAVINRLRGVRDSVDDAGQGTAYVRIDADDATPAAEPRLVASLMACVPADWEPRVGVASDPLAAHCAASVARPGHALRVPDATEPRHRFLAPLPVNLLPVDVHILAGLYDRGIHRLGQLDDLSAQGLTAILTEQSAAAPEADHSALPRAA